MKSLFNLVIVSSLLSLTTTISADPYVGVAVGTASYKVDTGTGGNFEEDGTGTKLYGGYNFNKYFFGIHGIHISKVKN